MWLLNEALTLLSAEKASSHNFHAHGVFLWVLMQLVRPLLVSPPSSLAHHVRLLDRAISVHFSLPSVHQHCFALWVDNTITISFTNSTISTPAEAIAP
jgi:hypothetical protein